MRFACCIFCALNIINICLVFSSFYFSWIFERGASYFYDQPHCVYVFSSCCFHSVQQFHIRFSFVNFLSVMFILHEKWRYQHRHWHWHHYKCTSTSSSAAPARLSTQTPKHPNATVISNFLFTSILTRILAINSHIYKNLLFPIYLMQKSANVGCAVLSGTNVRRENKNIYNVMKMR